VCRPKLGLVPDDPMVDPSTVTGDDAADEPAPGVARVVPGQVQAAGDAGRPRGWIAAGPGGRILQQPDDLDPRPELLLKKRGREVRGVPVVGSVRLQRRPGQHYAIRTSCQPEHGGRVERGSSDAKARVARRRRRRVGPPGRGRNEQQRQEHGGQKDSSHVVCLRVYPDLDRLTSWNPRIFPLPRNATATDALASDRLGKSAYNSRPSWLGG